MRFTILNANANHIPLTDKSVQCVVTSPPYWGLRDYGQVGQIGLEPTPEAYVAKIVAVFAEVWRVLRDDGTCWVNLGDSYNGHGETDWTRANGARRKEERAGTHNTKMPPIKIAGLKPKDLCGIPWRVAFALQAAGWYLRSDIIWAKPNPMPESVTDRPTKAHEYIFLLTKREKYFYDADAIREPHAETRWSGAIVGEVKTLNNSISQDGLASLVGKKWTPNTRDYNPLGRNIRTVWEIATQPYPEAHFATFPEEIALRCIKAGTSEKGACRECGAAWVRVVEREKPPDSAYNNVRIIEDSLVRGSPANHKQGKASGQKMQDWLDAHPTKTTGWQPTCKHDAPTVPCIVLDPFSGAGTVPLVADKLNRRGIGLELKADYCRMASRRCYDDAPLLAAMEG